MGHDCSRVDSWREKARKWTGEGGHLTLLIQGKDGPLRWGAGRVSEVSFILKSFIIFSTELQDQDKMQYNYKIEYNLVYDIMQINQKIY